MRKSDSSIFITSKPESLLRPVRNNWFFLLLPLHNRMRNCNILYSLDDSPRASFFNCCIAVEILRDLNLTAFSKSIWPTTSLILKKSSKLSGLLEKYWCSIFWTILFPYSDNNSFNSSMNSFRIFVLLRLSFVISR
jgi:hypothetical protein